MLADNSIIRAQTRINCNIKCKVQLPRKSTTSDTSYSKHFSLTAIVRWLSDSYHIETALNYNQFFKV